MFNPVERDKRDAVVKDWVGAAVARAYDARAPRTSPWLARCEIWERRLQRRSPRFPPPRTSTRSSTRRSSTARRPPSPARVWTRASMPHSQRPRWTPPLESTRQARARSSGAGGGFGSGRRAEHIPACSPTARDSFPGGGSGRGSPAYRRGERLSAVVCHRADGLRGVRRGGPRVPVPWWRRAEPRAARGPARDQGREEALAVAALSASARSPFREQGPRVFSLRSSGSAAGVGRRRRRRRVSGDACA